MKESQLPTHYDVMKNFLLIRYNLKRTQNMKDPAVKEVSEKLASNVEAIWTQASLPIICHQGVVKKILAYYGKYQSLLKADKHRRTDVKYLSKVETFVGHV